MPTAPRCANASSPPRKLKSCSPRRLTGIQAKTCGVPWSSRGKKCWWATGWHFIRLREHRAGSRGARSRANLASGSCALSLSEIFSQFWTASATCRCRLHPPRRRRRGPRTLPDGYSHERGSVAAPTAGLHFTPQILDALAARGVEIARITLHVGLGTFAPLRVESVAEVHLHRERYTALRICRGSVESRRQPRSPHRRRRHHRGPHP